jgi:hypothetical protein
MLARKMIWIPLILLVVAVFSATGYAIPAFSRQYGTSCSTCHLDFPKLNDFGKAFKDAGFKFPKDDEGMLKIPAVLLGAEAQKQLWPHTIWPGSIPGLPPIGLRMNNFFQVVGRNRNNFNLANPPGTVPTFVPRTDFETGLFSIFTAGNFGSDIAFWVDDDISVAGANADGGLGDGYLRFVNISRFFHMPTDSLHLRVGQFELDLPFSQARTHNISAYDIYSEANVGAMNALFPQQFVNNAFAFAGAAQGAELSGGHSYRGYHYSLAVVNQNTSGSAASPLNVPSATGGNNGGVGFFSDANFKDLYGRFSYRFNLERDPASRTQVQAAGTTGPHDHTYLSLGSFYLYGRSVQRLSATTLAGDPTVLTAREPFYRTGADFSFNYRTFNLYGLWMYGRDHSLLPIGPDGLPIPLPVSDSSPLPVAFIRSTPAHFSGGFLQADYLVFPWMIAIMRWDSVHSTADLFNGFLGSDATPFFEPFRSTRNRFSPGIQFLIHANIKAAFEYQIRPEQAVFSAADGTRITGPFRTNAATAGLEFVY